MTSQAFRTSLFILAAAASMAVALPMAARSETSADKSSTAKLLDSTGDLIPVDKGSRLHLGDEQAPLLTLPFANPRDGKPSGGLNVLERMGATLPDLPAEKAFKGTTDDAYGAFQRGLYLTAMNLALPKAQLGDAAAQTLVAELFDSGLGVRRSKSNAAFWYEQAATAGDPNAQFKYALMLMEGTQIKRDRKLADAMMRKAAEGGNPEAQFNIAQMKVAAVAGEKGLMAALPYYEGAAEQGVPDAQYALAQIYNTMDLPKEKRDLARYWLERAADSRYDTALYDMGVWYINGIGGDRDYDLGFMWMRRAAERGHIVAMNKLAYLYINAIGTRPDPIEAAKWYVLSRRAGLSDLGLEDFYLGIEDDQQKEAIRRADLFRAH
jgi:TPR repeat protein